MRLGSTLLALGVLAACGAESSDGYFPDPTLGGTGGANAGSGGSAAIGAGGGSGAVGGSGSGGALGGAGGALGGASGALGGASGALGGASGSGGAGGALGGTGGALGGTGGALGGTGGALGGTGGALGGTGGALGGTGGALGGTGGTGGGDACDRARDEYEKLLVDAVQCEAFAPQLQCQYSARGTCCPTTVNDPASVEPLEALVDEIIEHCGPIACPAIPCTETPSYECVPINPQYPGRCR